MLIDANIESTANVTKPLNIRKMGSKAAFLISLRLKIKGMTINDNNEIILINRYWSAILSITSNQYIYIDIVNKARKLLAKFSLDSILIESLNIKKASQKGRL